MQILCKSVTHGFTFDWPSFLNKYRDHSMFCDQYLLQSYNVPIALMQHAAHLRVFEYTGVSGRELRSASNIIRKEYGLHND